MDGPTGTALEPLDEAANCPDPVLEREPRVPLAPPARAMNELSDGQCVDELIGNDDQRALRHRAKFVMRRGRSLSSWIGT